MEKILEICEWCSDVFGTTLLILLVLILLPAIMAVAMLLFVAAVPVGIISSIITHTTNRPRQWLNRLKRPPLKDRTSS
ncbi:MAG: hypothetical protein IJJ72_02510 [Bacteroidales bacterium]|nr:hypothetical protein [Bacteroidales bacterium]